MEMHEKRQKIGPGYGSVWASVRAAAMPFYPAAEIEKWNERVGELKAAQQRWWTESVQASFADLQALEQLLEEHATMLRKHAQELGEDDMFDLVMIDLWRLEVRKFVVGKVLQYRLLDDGVPGTAPDDLPTKGVREIVVWSPIDNGFTSPEAWGYFRKAYLLISSQDTVPGARGHETSTAIFDAVAGGKDNGKVRMSAQENGWHNPHGDETVRTLVLEKAAEIPQSLLEEDD